MSGDEYDDIRNTAVEIYIVVYIGIFYLPDFTKPWNDKKACPTHPQPLGQNILREG